MFVHMTSIRVALGEITRLRTLMSETFLPIVYQQPGLVRAYLVEQVDDTEHAQLIVVWENQAMHERFRNSKVAEQLFQALNKRPGWCTQSQSYVARLKPEDVAIFATVPGQQVALSAR